MRLIDADSLKTKVKAMVEHRMIESDYDFGRNQAFDYVADILIDDAPTESTNTPTNAPTDLISRADAIKGVKELFACADIGNDEHDITYMLENLPSADTDRPTRLTNAEWKDFLSESFGISKSSAREMLHGMMSVKREDNFKKRFNQRRGERRTDD